METLTYFKNVHVTPKKLRLVRSCICKFSPSVAVSSLLSMKGKKSARVLAGIIKSAIDNAVNLSQVEETALKFHTLIVEEGQKLKRFEAGSRGTPKPFIRRYSHVKIIISTVD